MIYCRFFIGLVGVLACMHPVMASRLATNNCVIEAGSHLSHAINKPEVLLKDWIHLPTAPNAVKNQSTQLRLKDAILLALRYNPNIQNAELDRIIQRYQLRLAYNQFELQYALAGQAFVEHNRFNRAGSTTRTTAFATPEVSYRTLTGAQLSVAMDNNIAPEGDYNPLIRASIKQPLLRGFGTAVNEVILRDADDTEWLNQLLLQQSVVDQVTDVITAYRAMILSGNNLKNQKQQLDDAQTSYRINEKKIRAGTLEPTANIQQSYQIESLKLMVEQAENDFKTSAQNVLQTIGLDPDMRLSVPSDVIVDKLTIPNQEESIKAALAHNVQYLTLKRALRADKRALLVAKNEQLWQLDASATLQTGIANDVESSGNISQIFSGQNTVESVGVSVTIPLNDLARRNQLIQAKIKLEKDRINMLAAKRALITNIKNIITTIKSQAKRYELAQTQVMLADKSYDLEKKKQQAGIVSTLEVSATQNQLLQAQMGLISAKIAYLNEVSALERLLGTTLHSWDIDLKKC